MWPCVLAASLGVGERPWLTLAPHRATGPRFPRTATARTWATVRAGPRQRAASLREIEKQRRRRQSHRRTPNDTLAPLPGYGGVMCSTIGHLRLKPPFTHVTSLSMSWHFWQN